MPPVLSADPDFEQVLAELRAREPVFHHPEFGTSRADFDNMMAEGFREWGASGRRYSREFVLDLLEKRWATPHEDIWAATEFELIPLSSDVYLITYTLVQNKTRTTRRASIWQRFASGWKIVFHQGTLVQDV